MAIPLLTSPRLSSAGFRHGFSTRAGGVSAPPFDSFDFSTLRDPGGLVENQRRLAEAVGFEPARLYQVTQVHGAELVVAGGEPKDLLSREADALVAEPRTEAAVAVRVADCVPVLFADPHTGRVAAAHAGWRGVVTGVLTNVVDHLAGAPGGGPREHYIAAIGPCIGPCCFEVGLEVARAIALASAEDVVVDSDEAKGKAHVALRMAVRAQLRRLGLDDANIEDVPSEGSAGCTRCNPATLYSYRRDGDASGRLIGVIVSGLGAPSP